MTERATIDLLAEVIDRAIKAGADAADAVLFDSASVSVARRLGALEHLERTESSDIGLRVLVGHRQAVVSGSDRAPAALAELVERAVAMARTVPEDPYCGLADANQIATSIPDLDSFDATEPSAEQLTEWAARAEDAARAHPGITNSEGAQADWGRSSVALAASNGFSGSYMLSRFGVSVSVIAGEGTAMERDYDMWSSVFAADLPDPESIGRSAAERTVRRLGAKRIPSAQMPVVYDPRVARGLVGHLASAINGAAVARGTTFLKDRMAEAIFPESVTIVDDPLRPRGLRSKAFDGEGLPTARRAVVENGRLRTWFLDLRTARQLGLASTGHASRGTSSPPSPASTNLYMEPGAPSPAELIADIKDGFYVTELIGMGVNMVTGDYSRGAAGFRILNGEITHAVNEVTVAGNLTDMFAHLSAADDLTLRYGTDAPTIRIDGMTVAGA